MKTQQRMLSRKQAQCAEMQKESKKFIEIGHAFAWPHRMGCADAKKIFLLKS